MKFVIMNHPSSIELFLVCRLQAQTLKSAVRYTGMADAFRRTYRNEGIRGFYKGWLPNMLKAVPSASITYLVYEDMKIRLSIK